VTEERRRLARIHTSPSFPRAAVFLVFPPPRVWSLIVNWPDGADPRFQLARDCPGAALVIFFFALRPGAYSFCLWGIGLSLYVSDFSWTCRLI